MAVNVLAPNGFSAYRKCRVQPASIPESLKKVDQWVARAELKPNSKIGRIPLNTQGLTASALDPQNWLSFSDACDFYLFDKGDNRVRGTGFVLDGKPFAPGIASQEKDEFWLVSSAALRVEYDVTAAALPSLVEDILKEV